MLYVNETSPTSSGKHFTLIKFEFSDCYVLVNVLKCERSRGGGGGVGGEGIADKSGARRLFPKRGFCLPVRPDSNNSEMNLGFLTLVPYT